MHRSPPPLALFLLLTVGAGCASAPEIEDPEGYTLRSYERVLLGEPLRIQVWTKDPDAADRAAKQAYRAVARIDQAVGDQYSISEVSTLVSGGPWMPISDELYRIIDRGVQLAEATDGAYDPTLGPLVLLWRQARKTGRLPREVDLNSARSRTGWNHVEVAPRSSRVRLATANMALDLSNVERGAACDAALAEFVNSKLTRSRVDFGTTLSVGEAPPGLTAWEVALPEHAGGGMIGLKNGGLSTAGADETWIGLDGRRYTVEIDPASGMGYTSRRLATVAARSGLDADVIAEALRATPDPQRRAAITLGLEVRAWVSEP